MKHRYTAQITAAVLFAMTTSPAFSADPDIPARGPVPFESFDADSNGYVNQEEFDRVRSERISSRTQEQRQLRNMGKAPVFSDLDVDADGMLSREEVQAHQRKHQQTRSYSMDKPMGSTGHGTSGGQGGMSPGGGMGSRK